MTLEVRPIEHADIPEVSRFLTAGFGAPSDAEFSAPDVLHWKCFDSIGPANITRGVVATDDKEILAYIGLCPLQFIGGGLTQVISAGHGVDWLASKKVVSAGIMVGGLSDEGVDVSFSIGGTDIATKMKKKFKNWKFLSPIATYYRSLHPMHHLRPPLQSSILKSSAKVLRDYGRNIILHRRKPSVSLKLQQTDSFGEEVTQILNSCRMPEIHIRRTPDLLNHFLRYPRKNITGWHIIHNDVVCGFALLSIVINGNQRIGKIVDCCLDSLAHNHWHAAVHFISKKLYQLSADIVVCYGTIPLIAQALEENGFACNDFSPFAIRDPQKLIPEDPSFYLTHLVADYAYL